jgi:short subunit dehydrogenase-like uncharacterized protein
MMTEDTGGNWLIYGANGYTGRLIAEAAAARGMTPIIAGRNREAVEALAGRLKLDSRVFALDSAAQIQAALDGISLVLNCAGPFAPTAEKVVDACIAGGIHYLDISGEPEMFEKHLARGAEAKATGAVVIPGVGFDVVPSDTLARCLADRMPGAVSLEMAFMGDGSGSAGSAKTTLGMMADKCKVRREGRIVRKPLAFSQQQVRFSDREAWCMSIPWGDISTAFHSTGIPNITMYIATTRKAARRMRAMSPLMSLLSIPALRRKMFSRLEASIQGPDKATRERCCMRLWGRVTDASGNTLEATVDTPEGFTFTTAAALLCVNKVLSQPPEGGCYTPTMAFGSGLLDEIPGTALHWREDDLGGRGR